MRNLSFRGFNALELKLMAMVFMLCDHAWATLPIRGDWLTCVGRLAFPIFAFQLAEGYAHTSDPKAYRRRMLIWALITEIPFNFMSGGWFFNPFHQNVLFTFYLALLMLERIDRARERGVILGTAAVVGWTVLGFLAGTLTMLDYMGFGVVTVIVFYLTRDVRWGRLVQAAVLYAFNVELMGGLSYPIVLLGREFLLPRQGLALLALPLIWLYNGEQGRTSPAIRRACYAFYPVHILVLVLIALFL